MRRVSIFVLFMMCAPYVFGNIFYVSTSGNDNSGNGSAASPWRSLKAAVTKVPAGQGHTIKLSSGTFVESGSFNVPPGVSIEGAGVDQTIVKAASAFYFNPGNPGFALDKFLMTLYSSVSADGNQSLKNFTIDGDGKKLHGGIYVKNRNRIVIENVKVTATNFCGIWIWDVKNSTLRQVTLINCSWGSTGWASGGLQLANLEAVEITGLNVDESTGYGIKALGSGGNRITRLKVHDSRISVNPAGKWNNGSAPNIAFELWEVYLTDCEIYNTYMDNHLSLVNVQTAPTGGRSIRVHHNVFDLLDRAGGRGYAIELSINDAEIDHNLIKGGSYGIAHWSPAHCANWAIHHNTFHSLNSGYPGDIIRAQVSGLHRVKFYNNTVELMGSSTINVIGLHAGKSDNLDIKNNLIINSNTSYSWFPNQLIFLEKGASASGLIVSNNLLDKLPLGSVAGTYSNNLSLNCKITQSGARPDPYYLPVAGSPLIDGGVNVGYPFQGSAPDIGAYEFKGSIVPANQLPAVTITAPATNSKFIQGSSVSITAAASDKDGTVSKVEFFNGTTKLGEDTTSPYSFVWSDLAKGNYTLTVKATDNAGGIAISSQVKIEVSGAPKAPNVAITSPVQNAKFPAASAITISADASDPDGTIAKVEFFKGTDKLGEDNSSPFSFVWSNVPAGSYALTAKATDNLDGSTTSTAVQIIVEKANVLPTVSLSSPTANAVFVSGSAITITAAAADTDGKVVKVEFFSGAEKVAEDSNIPYSFVWNGALAGNHVITAKASDDQGGTSTSKPVTITVNPDDKPAIAITSPKEEATFGSGQAIMIIADAIDPNGIERVEFFGGPTKLGQDTTEPYTYEWNTPIEGKITISAKLVSLDGTITSDAVTILVVGKPTANAGDDITLTGSNSALLMGVGTSSDGSDVSFRWQQVSGPGEISFSDSNSNSPTVSNLIEGTYTIELTVTDAYGVTVADLLRIHVSGTDIVSNKIPRYFSPNDDGINDKWEWPNVAQYANSALTIFNRAGQKIYEIESYNNSWDGTSLGKPLQADAYYYVIRSKDNGDIKGAVRIIR